MADLIPYRPGHGPPAADPLDLQVDFDGRPKTSTEFVGVREYLAMARRHWWIVLLTLLLSISYTANSVLQERPRYRSQSTVRLVDARRAITGDMGRNTGSEMPYSYQSDPLESQIQILQSAAVASVAVDLKGLRLVTADGHPFPDEITEATVSDSTTAESLALTFSENGYSVQSNGRTMTSTYGFPIAIDGVHVLVAKRPLITTARLNVISREGAIARARAGFSAFARPKTDILDFGYIGSEPRETKRIVNAMAEAFQVYNAKSARQLSQRRRAFLESQLKSTDSLLANATGSFSAFRSGRQIFSAATRAGAQESGLIDIDTKRAELDAERVTYVKLLDDAKKVDNRNVAGSLRVLASSPGVAANPVVLQYYSQLSTYEKTRDDLLAAGAAQSNPDVVAINAQIPALRSKIIDAVESLILSIQARVDALDRLRAAGASKIAEAPATETQELDLRENVQRIRQMSRQLEDELQRARMSEAVEAGQVEIVQLGNDGYQIATGKSRKILLGIVVGLMLGFGAAVLVDSLNASVRRRSDIERQLGIPGLAVIPRLTKGTKAPRWARRALPRMMSNGKNGSGKGIENLVTITNNSSAASEAFRTLRTSLMFSQAVRAMRTLVITSASPGEGKTTTASNLAVSFAQQGMRVLLLDCDLRRAHVHRLFGVPREPGLTELALGYETEEDVTRSTSVPGLYIITAGKLPPNPAEMLAGEGMRRAVAALTEGYDLVVIDTPPLLAASDAAIVSTLAHGVIMVLRAGTTDIAAAQQAIQQLGAVGARVVGAVLNDPDAQVPRYGAYYTYEYTSKT